MTAQQLTDLRELDSRTSGGLVVRMLWRAHDDQLFVTVWDSQDEEAFTIELRRGEDPLEVFRHPFSYSDIRKSVAPELPLTQPIWR
jgi:hypothetical protein